MRKSRFSETKIVNILKEAQTGVCTVEETCRKHGISGATYYKWRSKFGGMEASDIKRMRELEHENARLKQMYADVSLQLAALKSVIEKNF